jgi:hypothetical protein
MPKGAKMTERYLDWEDKNAFANLSELATDCVERDVTVLELLEALETLRTHLRRKYYGG